MKQTWRWFGPKDLVSLDDVVQAGAAGIVSALHHVPPGEVWTLDEIARRQQEVGLLACGAPSGLTWDVVESLPVSEAIKKQSGAWRQHIEAYRQSMENLAASGIDVICYNFMPILDWTRTDLAYGLANGATCMRFDLVDFAAFDIHVLARPAAVEDYDETIREAASQRIAEMGDAQKSRLKDNLVCGLPGAAENMSLDDVKAHLAEYDGISAARLRQNQLDFLAEIVPDAERLGLRLCCHPDDPPVPLLGLPRVMSTEADYTHLVTEIDSPANGITLCSGSLGARPDNDLPGMMERLGPRVHFLHLRNVTRETEGVRCSFHEAEHLGGDTDMVALVSAILSEEARRRADGRADAVIPMRPDHGQDILDDLGRKAQPGYPSIGRLKGLAELRGVEMALSQTMNRWPTD